MVIHKRIDYPFSLTPHRLSIILIFIFDKLRLDNIILGEAHP